MSGPNVDVTAVETSSGGGELVVQVKVVRSHVAWLDASPPAADVPADVRQALYAWLDGADD